MSVSSDARSPKGQVVDFDAALLDACPPVVRANLMAEATMLVQVFAPEGRAEQLQAMALALSSSERDGEMDRDHARKLAAALRRLAHEAER
jgi:hypothetical protein